VSSTAASNTAPDYREQFDEAKKQGWIDLFKSVAATYKFPPEILIAIGSRETGLQNIVGDHGHGFGIMQIDDRSYPDWCHSGQWKDPRTAIGMGAQVLSTWQSFIVSKEGKLVTFKTSSISFFGKTPLSAMDLLRTAIAAYNSGGFAYYNLTISGDPDRGTTGRNYSSDVLTRAGIFRVLLLQEAPSGD
jgi:hypothetical protein